MTREVTLRRRSVSWAALAIVASLAGEYALGHWNTLRSVGGRAAQIVLAPPPGCDKQRDEPRVSLRSTRGYCPPSPSGWAVSHAQGVMRQVFRPGASPSGGAFRTPKACEDGSLG